MPIGTSYQPGAPMTPQQGMARPALTPQEAVRIFNLRLPKNPQNAPVPGALLNSQGGGATSSLQQLLQMLMQRASGAPREMTGGNVPAIDHGLSEVPASMPMPRIKIGDNNRAPLPEPGGEAPLFDPGRPQMGAFRMPEETLF